MIEIDANIPCIIDETQQIANRLRSFVEIEATVNNLIEITTTINI